MTVEIRQAASADLHAVAELFDQYRQFYHQDPDPALAREFIEERMDRGESTVLLALCDGKPGGFVQLYPTFSSVAARRIWILNDLFVAPEARRGGVARALMAAAEDHARDTGAVRLVLETLPDNAPAQALYEDLGWEQGQTLHYERAVQPGSGPEPD